VGQAMLMAWMQSDLGLYGLKIYHLREKLPFLKANPNEFEFFCGLIGHLNKILNFPCMPAVIRTY
jgi:hypothetical protein